MDVSAKEARSDDNPACLHVTLKQSLQPGVAFARKRGKLAQMAPRSHRELRERSIVTVVTLAFGLTYDQNAQRVAGYLKRC
jgi:hypothetical protein